MVADIDAERARVVAEENSCEWTTDWRDVVERSDLAAVVASTVNKFLAPVTVAAAENGKHVLCEKPLGRNAHEAEQMVNAALKTGILLKTGFNHRYHPAIQKAHSLFQQGAIGPLLYIRATYGHGGRPGYDKEWRADAELAGGGELLDQGVHVVDLCRWFAGDFSEASGFTHTCFWNLGYHERGGNGLQTPRRRLEDNAFALLRTADGRIAQLHTSWTQWKNRFTFEVFGADGYLIVDGLGGSYGIETLTSGRRRAESGPPIEDRYEFPGPDSSWRLEWMDFTSAIRENRQPLANGQDGLQAMRAIAAIYESALTGRVARVNP
jgi:predicted dehydrogenase